MGHLGGSVLLWIDVHLKGDWFVILYAPPDASFGLYLLYAKRAVALRSGWLWFLISVIVLSHGNNPAQ